MGLTYVNAELAEPSRPRRHERIRFLVGDSSSPEMVERAFGFLPAHRFGLRCEFPSPPEAFMALELAPGGLDGAEATVHYHPAFSGV